MTETKNRAIRSIREYARQFDDAKDRHRCLLGDGAGNVDATSGRDGYVNIRRRDSGLAAGTITPDEVICIRADIPFIDGLPIIVGRDGISGDEIVLGRDIDSLVEGIYDWVRQHHEQHEFQNPEGGFDVVWVQKPQFVPLLCHPTDPTSMRVLVESDFYAWDDAWNWFGTGLSDDLTAHVPAANRGVYVLISIDGATNALQATVGTSFFLWPAPAIADVMPSPPSGCVPLAAIYLINTTTAIEWDNIYDVRLFNQSTGGSLTPIFDDTEGDPTDVDLSGPDDGVSVYASRRDHRHDLDPDVVLDAPQYAGSLLVSAPVSLSGNCALSGDCFTGNCWVEFDLSGNGSGTFLRNDGERPYWGELSLEEQAVADVDVAGYGQIWVKDDAPNTLWFTDDTGADVQLGVGGGALPAVAGVGYALISDGVNSWVADQTPTWTGLHTFNAGLVALAIDSTVPSSLMFSWMGF